MLDDFFIRALIAGLATAALMGPIGCFIIWRRMSFFGDTLSHSALLGVGIGLMLHTNLTMTVFMIALLIAGALHLLKGRANLSSDASLGILSHSALALGLLMVSFLPPSQIDFTSLFFGDILATSRQDVYIVLASLIAGLLILAFIWHPLLITTVNQDIAKAEKTGAQRAELIFTLLLTMVIALSIKIVGVLLISALLIIPAAAARQIARAPETMALFASLFGCLSILGGLWGSLELDLPSGPAIVTMALIIFCLMLAGKEIARIKDKQNGRQKGTSQS